MTTVKDYIIETLNKQQKEDIIEQIEIIKNEEIETSKYFSYNTQYSFIKKNIRKINDLMKTNIDLIKTTDLIFLINIIEKQIIYKKQEKERKLKTKEQAMINHENIINILNEINNDKKLNILLKEEIIFATSEKNKKKWLYSSLNLSELEINTLRKYMLKTPSIDTIIHYIDNQYEIMEKIYINIRHYIKKVKYKQILNNYYQTFDDLNINQKTCNLLKRHNIYNINNFIEYSKQQLQEISGLGNTRLENILSELEKKGIILLDKEIIIELKLNEENAGIIVPNRKTKC